VRRLADSNEHLARIQQKMIDLPLYLWIGHQFRPIAIGAGETRCSDEQAADQRPFPVGLAAIFSRVWTVQLGVGCHMIRDTFDLKVCHFFG